MELGNDVWQIIHLIYIKNNLSISKMFDASSFSYILPTHRLTIYVYGILLAYFLQYLKPKIHLTKVRIKLQKKKLFNLAVLGTMAFTLVCFFYMFFSYLAWSISYGSIELSIQCFRRSFNFSFISTYLGSKFSFSYLCLNRKCSL